MYLNATAFVILKNSATAVTEPVFMYICFAILCRNRCVVSGFVPFIFTPFSPLCLNALFSIKYVNSCMTGFPASIRITQLVGSHSFLSVLIVPVFAVVIVIV